MKRLIVVDQENGMFGGYEARQEDGKSVMHQFFNSRPDDLFASMKHYTDIGYLVTCMTREEFDRIPVSRKPELKTYLNGGMRP